MRHIYISNFFPKTAYPIRGLIKNLGYLEGWASYVTLLSYEYSELDEYYANLYKYNNAIVLCLSARADIGVHYENWTKDGKPLESTITYEVKKDGVFKSPLGGQYVKISGAELLNFYSAVRAYYKLIRKELY